MYLNYSAGDVRIFVFFYNSYYYFTRNYCLHFIYFRNFSIKTHSTSSKVNGSVKHEPLMIKSGVNHFQMEPDCVLNVKELVLSTLPKPLEQIEIHLHPITKVDVGNITGYLSYWKHQEEDALEAIKESLGKWSKHASKIPMEKVLEEIQHAKNHQSYGSKRILNLVLASLALTLIVLLIMFIAKRYWMFKIKKKLPMDQIPMTNNEAGVDTITQES